IGYLNEYIYNRYDGAGQRVWRKVTDVYGATTTSRYVLDGAATVGEFSDTGALRHWNTAVGRIASDGTRYVYRRDHLGSVRAVQKRSDGSVVEARDYYPFGLQMPGRVYVQGQPTREDFTGHERDDETGLHYAGARYYMAALGRFTSTDPMNQYPSPYVYAGNNPISLVDPDGMWAGDYYDSEGRHIGNDGIDDDKVYVNSTRRGGELSGTELGISHTDFATIASIVGHEGATDDYEEYLWIAHASNNNASGSGVSLLAKLMSGYSSAPSDKKTPLATSDNSMSARYGRRAAADVLTGGADPTGGADFWDGDDFAARGSGHPKFRQYSTIGIHADILGPYVGAVQAEYPRGYRLFGVTYSVPSPSLSQPTEIVGTNPIFVYRTGANSRYSIDATGTRGRSIFWRSYRNR
ncbi:MAG: RHS repeat-associated core domain-containing protein, partial [Bacteroidota bacterium]